MSADLYLVRSPGAPRGVVHVFYHGDNQSVCGKKHKHTDDVARLGLEDMADAKRIYGDLAICMLCEHLFAKHRQRRSA